MNAVCRHHIVKPFACRDGTLRDSNERINFSDDAMEYCTHPNSRHLPGTPQGVTCGGDVTKCGIPRAKR